MAARNRGGACYNAAGAAPLQSAQRASSRAPHSGGVRGRGVAGGPGRGLGAMVDRRPRPRAGCRSIPGGPPRAPGPRYCHTSAAGHRPQRESDRPSVQCRGRALGRRPNARIRAGRAETARRATDGTDAGLGADRQRQRIAIRDVLDENERRWGVRRPRGGERGPV